MNANIFVLLLNCILAGYMRRYYASDRTKKIISTKMHRKFKVSFSEYYSGFSRGVRNRVTGLVLLNGDLSWGKEPDFMGIFVGSIAQSYHVVLLVKLKLSILKRSIENSRNISLDNHKNLLQITLILVHFYFISPDAQRLWFT
jgi:hypothetical protein